MKWIERNDATGVHLCVWHHVWESLRPALVPQKCLVDSGRYVPNHRNRGV